MGRGIIIALALSLAANVFLGGFVAGKFAGGGDRSSHRSFSFRDKGAHEFTDLTPAARESLKRAFMAHRDEARAKFKEARKLHKEFVAVLTAEKFERAEAEAIVEKFAAIENSTRADMARLMVEAAAGLPVEDRKALARHLDRRSDHRRGRSKDRRPPPADGPPAPPADGPPPLEDQP